MSENAKLTRGSIRGHLVSQTLPMIIGVAAVMSIGLVDAFFIGQLGRDELAAISFIFPISVAITSMGVGMMVGINSVVARALGEGDMDKAKRRANFGIVLALVAGMVLALLLYLLLGPVFTLMQADEALMPLIRAYMVPYTMGFPLIMAIMGLNGVLRGQGEARLTSYVSLSYAVANWILDPILITGAFGFEGFGIEGAAYATIVGWAIGVAFALWLMRRTDIPVDPAMVLKCRVKEPLWAIIKVAGPAAMSNSINPIGLSVLTALVASEGAAAVAGFGAAGRVQSFAVVPLLGLSGSIGAIVGQNWGANQPNRARRAMFGAGIFALVWGLGMGVVLTLFGDWFADFFSDDPDVIDEFALYLSIAAWGYAGYGILITANGALNAVDRASYALIQSVARVFLIMLPFAWLMRAEWGSAAIYAAELAANLIGGAIAAFVVWRVLSRGRPRGHS
ncbi:MATE family efflux transporter [Altererythrobacter sp. GH1-8]|uniref:MATE family efflux transporter n=1 Tax=Altererythrobacter sp. GH1-8 TaxID=3349333 RepID=UPI00374CF5A0